MLQNISFIPINSIATLYFFLFSSLLITITSIFQYQSIFKYLKIQKDVILNKDRIIAQIYGLKDSHSNFFSFYALFLTTFSILIIKNVFHIGSQQNYLLEAIVFFMFISFIIEYHFFLMNVAVTAEEHNISIETELLSRENAIKRITIENTIKTNIKFSDNFYDKITIILNNIQNEKEFLSIEIENLYNKQKDFREKSGLSKIKNSIFIRTDSFDIYEIIEEENKIITNKIILVPSMAYFSFYKVININKTYIKALFEGIIVSLILYMSLTFKF